MSKDPCRSCGSTEHTIIRVQYIKDKLVDQCNMCEKLAMPWMPDVYFDSSKGSDQTDFNLQDRRKGPMRFSSKREKAIIMRQLGLREAGDKQHGSRNFDKFGNRQWK